MNEMKKFYEVEGIPDSSGYFPTQNNLKQFVSCESSYFAFLLLFERLFCMISYSIPEKYLMR